MSNHERIKDAVFRAIGTVNDLLPAEHALEASEGLVIIGKDAKLDSMGFVNFVVALEEELERSLGREVNVTDLLYVSEDTTLSICTVADLTRVLGDRL